MDGARVHVGLAAWLSPEHSARSPNCLRAGQAALAQDLPGGPAPTDSQEARPGTERCPEPHRGPAGVPGPVTHVRTCQAPGHAGCGPVVFAHQATCFAFSSQAKPSWEQPAGNSVAGQGFPGRLEAQQDMFGCEFALQNHLPQSGGCRSAQGLRAGPGLLTPAFCRPAHPHSPLQACSPPPPPLCRTAEHGGSLCPGRHLRGGYRHLHGECPSPNQHPHCPGAAQEGAGCHSVPRGPPGLPMPIRSRPCQTHTQTAPVTLGLTLNSPGVGRILF